jgi:SAM-dependent methyltransferase
MSIEIYTFRKINYLSKILKNNSSIKKVLEIGCGGCVILEQIKKGRLYVCGIDSSPFAATQGKKKNIEVKS